jgi:hypothetical protein
MLGNGAGVSMRVRFSHFGPGVLYWLLPSRHPREFKLSVYLFVNEKLGGEMLPPRLRIFPTADGQGMLLGLRSSKGRDRLVILC